MSTSEYEFTQEEVKKLEEYRDKQQDYRLKLRFIALLMLAMMQLIHVVASLVEKNIKTKKIGIFKTRLME